MANGSVLLNENGRYRVSGDETRAVRSKTLDTGTAIVNLGADHGDKTITVYADVDEATFNIIDNIQRNQTRVTIATRDGCFNGIIKSKVLQGITLRITLWIESRLDED
jgi:hypothetical protein